MREITAREMKEGAVTFLGAADFDVRDEGISPRRLPAWTRPQVPQAMDAVVRMPSGVRLAFETNSSAIRLKVQTTRLVTPPAQPRQVAFDLVLDGAQVLGNRGDRGNTILLDRRDPSRFELVRAPAYEVAFDGLAAGNKHCELWLPHDTVVELRGIEIDDGATIAPAPVPTERRWLHYGSSISHCIEADRPTGTWPAVAARLAGMHLHSLGFGGQCHLDPFVARTIRDTQADVISLKVGINVINMDSMRERVFTPLLHGFLDSIRERKAHTPIVLVSPIHCPSAELQPGPTMPNGDGKFVTFPGNAALRNGCLTLVRVREIIAATVAARRAAGDGHLHYLDGLQLFGAADAADLPDDLHPNPAGYARMGERFARAVFSAEGFGL